MKNITIPELSLVLLVGPSGCGKSTFARKHFRPTEIVSSDHYRGVVSDDESNQAASRDAFEILHQVVAKRLAWKRFTVVDATNLQADARKPFLELARKYHFLTTAIVFDLEEAICQTNNLQRPDRVVPERVITQHVGNVKNAVAGLEREGINRIYKLCSVADIEKVVVERIPLWVDQHHHRGPFDIIGDVHGCFDELLSLLTALEYRIAHLTDPLGIARVVVEPPPGRTAVFVGDLADRGPDSPAVLRLVMNMVKARTAWCVLGNHDHKLLRKLRGNQVKLAHGLAETMDQLARESAELAEHIRIFLDDLVSHYVFDHGRLVVAHAGLREDLHGRASGVVRSFAMFGDVTGEVDEQGLPIRRDWAADYKGKALVVYGHTPVAEPRWMNNTVNIDTGCVFGGRLTALRYPERETVSIPARKQYCEARRGFLEPEENQGTEPAQQQPGKGAPPVDQ